MSNTLQAREPRKRFEERFAALVLTTRPRVFDDDESSLEFKEKLAAAMKEDDHAD